PTDEARQERKPKREKKKKKKQEGNHETEMVDADDDDMHKKHRSVFEKVQRSLKIKETLVEVGDKKEEEEEKEKVEEPAVEHDLGRLTQPEPVIFDVSKLSYETLPPWLASPGRVAPDVTRPFVELGISPESSRILESKGFKE